MQTAFELETRRTGREGGPGRSGEFTACVECKTRGTSAPQDDVPSRRTN
jgi:hypothetical protein